MKFGARSLLHPVSRLKNPFSFGDGFRIEASKIIPGLSWNRYQIGEGRFVVGFPALASTLRRCFAYRRQDNRKKHRNNPDDVNASPAPGHLPPLLNIMRWVLSLFLGDEIEKAYVFAPVSPPTVRHVPVYGIGGCGRAVGFIVEIDPEKFPFQKKASRARRR